jgi:hypothetical protein
MEPRANCPIVRLSFRNGNEFLKDQPMPKYQVAAAERWGIRVSYDVDAPNAEEAVRMVKDQEVEVETYSVNWEDHMEVDEILSVESETERFAVDPFNRPAAQPAPETEPTPVRTLQNLAQDSLDVQDACNLCGVARSFSELCVELKNWPHQDGDFREKRDAIVKMWVSKIEHLTALEQSMSQLDHDIVSNLARERQTT